jgi:lipoprotein-anchoring transpeptidase ErfK/SrfK
VEKEAEAFRRVFNGDGMKELLIFSATAGVLLSSATPPPASAPASPQTPTAAFQVQPESSAPAPEFPRLVYEPEELPPPVAPRLQAEPVLQEPSPARPSGVKVVVSLPLQKAYVFDDGELIATSPVSTGKKGYETPAGTFRILQKKVHHRSNRYSNAPMPYMQRLTWQGVALHAGSLPGYPASHGCIRLPRSFAKKLYGLTDFSTEVTITRERPKSAEAALDLS